MLRAGIGAWLLAAVAAASPAQDPPAAAPPADELAQLRAMLMQPGADGREARETAIQRLVAWPEANGHAILQEALGRTDDPDEVRQAILVVLQRHLLGNQGQLFGGADEAVRRQILRGYVASLAPHWRGSDARAEDVTVHPLRSASRLVLQRMPARDLEAVLREHLAATAAAEDKLAALRCVADLQQLHLTKVLADFVESPDSVVRSGARASLQLLTFHEEEFATRAQFDAWFEQFGGMRYVDLAERAARRLPLRLERLRQDRARLQVESARELVRAYTRAAPGIAWQAIGARALVDDTAVLDACLEQLQQALGERLPGDADPVARQAFCRGLLDRWRLVAADQVQRRAMLVEVAAYCVRPEEVELATEVVGMLTTQLETSSLEARMAALRGLRRFPSVEVRSRLVRHATALATSLGGSTVELEATLSTLALRSAPRWYAPLDGDADAGEWLALVRSIARLLDRPDLRDKGLQLALTLDSRDQRRPEVFKLLLELATDPTFDAKYRSTCLIHLHGWSDDPTVADELVRTLQGLLADPTLEVRKGAAEALAKLPQRTDRRRGDWITSTIAAVRDRLHVEPAANVLQALVDLMLVCGREPQMAENAISALNVALGQLGKPPRPEHQFRLAPLLSALSTIAADANASRGPWLGACGQLIEFGRRPSLRLILKNHAAIDLAKDVTDQAGVARELAQKAMHVIVATALLKQPSEGAWSSTEELLAEAREVRGAFSALDAVDESLRPDRPEHRILRLEVELAGGKAQDVVSRAQSWLANGSAARSGMTPAQRASVRMLAAEAHLALNKPADAARLIAEREADAPPDPRWCELQVRVARALMPTDMPAAVPLFERAWRGTATEDPAFRSRLVEWAQAQVRLDPASRDATLAEIDRYAALFDARECPQELREAVQLLRGQR